MSKNIFIVVFKFEKLKFQVILPGTDSSSPQTVTSKASIIGMSSGGNAIMLKLSIVNQSVTFSSR